MTEKTKKRPAFVFNSGDDARVKRRRLAMNQSTFWSRVACTQSAGSRYESCRDIPDAVKMLLHIAYGTEKQANEMLAWLRENEKTDSPAS